MPQRFAVIGAGIIGLLTARELRARGFRVLLLDVGQPGREASWAGGGIVSPLYPWRYPDAVSALAADAQAAHAALAEALRRETGIDPEYAPCGLLMPEAPEADQALAWCRRHGREVAELDAGEVARLQPGLGMAAARALWMPGVGNVRNPRLLQALLASLAADPAVEARWGVTCALARDGNGVRLRVDGHEEHCAGIVVATGAWTAGLLAPLGIELAVEPVKGQMLLYPPQPGLLSPILLHAGRYLIPRRDGRILCGSTLEYSGFDRATTPEAGVTLAETAAGLLPALRAVRPEAQWAGLRPGAPAGIPYIARLADNLLVNAGHFRNGLVLAPASARLGVALLMGESTAIDPAPYAADAPRP